MSSSKYSHIVSYGGGVNSTAMIILMIENKMKIDHVVFADTEEEIPETYEYLEIMNNYLKKYSIPLTVVHPFKMRGLYERCKERKVIPSQLWRWCTRDVKVKPIHKFYKKIGGFIHEYLGIDYSETHRVKVAKEIFIQKHYPLVDRKLDRQDCIEIIKSAGLPIPLKSGCFFCPFNNQKRSLMIKKEHPLLFQKSIDLEEQNKYFPKQTLGTKFILREINDSLDDSTDDYCGAGFS